MGEGYAGAADHLNKRIGALIRRREIHASGGLFGRRCQAHAGPIGLCKRSEETWEITQSEVIPLQKYGRNESTKGGQRRRELGGKGCREEGELDESVAHLQEVETADNQWIGISVAVELGKDSHTANQCRAIITDVNTERTHHRRCQVDTG